MITANVVHRVFRLRAGEAVGTAFTIEDEGREYLVTARHVVPSFSGTGSISLFSSGGWLSLQATLVGHGSGDLDVSVLAVDRQLTPSGLSMPATSSGVVYGQEVHFLGFPYGYLGRYAFGPDGFPLPFVKRATLSLFDGPLFLLDGHNNPGFSGGPVIFRQANQEFKVFAVISAYRYVYQPVFDGASATDLSFKYNTGIVEAYGIDEATRLIRANPIGYVLPNLA